MVGGFAGRGRVFGKEGLVGLKVEGGSVASLTGDLERSVAMIYDDYGDGPLGLWLLFRWFASNTMQYAMAFSIGFWRSHVVRHALRTVISLLRSTFDILRDLDTSPICSSSPSLAVILYLPFIEGGRSTHWI